MAALQGLNHATWLGMERVILETDASNLAMGLHSNEMDRAELSVLFRETRDRMLTDFSSCDVSVCPRNCNQVTDCLAAYGVSLGSDDSDEPST
uniref:RNase H type-1 domain-containing protein n=1 Tax=Arundo donax TaxID=35708 RepID=A0A0A9EE31_ARUDO